jgi:hypothetical protein
MSFSAIQRVIDWKLPPTAKTVLLLLAFHENKDTGRCDPSVAGLAAESGLSERAVRNALAVLRKGSAVSVVERPGCRSSYVIAQDYPCTTCTPALDAPLHQVQPCTTCTPAPRSETPAPRSETPAPRAYEPKEPKEPQLASSFNFFLRNGKTWNLPQPLLDSMQEAHPGIDVEAEMRKAALWCQTNPGKAKTAAGMPRFLNSWIGRQAKTAPKEQEQTSLRDMMPTPDPEAWAYAAQVEAEIKAEREADIAAGRDPDPYVQLFGKGAAKK